MLADPIQIALRVAEALEVCGLRYLVGGSLASSLSGEPRSTLDVDLVVSFSEDDVQPFVDSLGDEFHAMDDATLTANGSDYLEAHLRRVIDWIETRSPVELLALGIGHDVDTIYTRSVTITDSEQLGDAMAHELIELLGNVAATARYPFAVNH